MQRLPREHMNPTFRARLRAQITGGVIRLRGTGQGGGGMPSFTTPAQADLHAVYAYDAYNRRIMGIVVGVDTQFHTWDGWRQVVQYSLDTAPNPDAAVPTKQFVWGSRLDELLSYRRKNGSTWENYFVLHGGQDTAAKLVNSSGAVVEQYEYDPYGKVSVYVGSSTTAVATSSVGLPFLWKGVRLDSETGLLQMRNRYYSTGLGRFLTRDPLGVWADQVCFGNGYCYAGNNPVNGADPLGLMTVSDDPAGLKLTYGLLVGAVRILRILDVFTTDQEDWICKEMARGCVGLVSVIAGIRVQGKNCWDTKEKAEAEKRRLAAQGNCKPLMYAVQFHEDGKGRDPSKPDTRVDPGSGKVDMSNWDASYPDPGSNFNFGAFVGRTVWHANNAHNPGAVRMPDKKEADMAAFVSSESDFDAVKDSAGFNRQVWCVVCRGDFSGKEQ
jgi:RHS repeat-associated protein